jgi:hypothetical protein
MAFENLFIRNRRTLAGIELDAVVNETYENVVTASRFPIEKGSDITDNSILEPRKISIEAVVSDNPLGLAAFGEIVDNVTDLFGSATETNLTRSQAAYRELVRIEQLREPITIQTKLETYNNMLITNISTNQDVDSSAIVRLFIEAQELIITESQIVELTEEQLQVGSPREQGTSPSNRGRQQTVEPSETQERSVLKAVVNWISD